jgi:hypothetical protein
MLVASLDLALAFNHVDHVHLLNIFWKLSIPSVYGCFYKGFLQDHIFHVHCGSDFSKWKKECCGSPQSMISSPILFIIYMEDFIRKTLPVANAKWINMGMFADDLTIWKTGNNIPQMSNDVSDFINNTVDPWAVSHNMIQKESKCHSFLFSQWCRDSKPSIMLHGLQLSYGLTKEHSYLHLLGICLNSRLTFKYHLTYICQKTGLCLHQLSRISNSIYGLNQACPYYYVYIICLQCTWVCCTSLVSVHVYY